MLKSLLSKLSLKNIFYKKSVLDRIYRYLNFYHYVLLDFNDMKDDHEYEEIIEQIYCKVKYYKMKVEIDEGIDYEVGFKLPTDEIFKEIYEIVTFIDNNKINEGLMNVGFYKNILEDIIRVFKDDKKSIELIMKLDILGKTELTEKLKKNFGII